MAVSVSIPEEGGPKQELKEAVGLVMEMNWRGVMDLTCVGKSTKMSVQAVSEASRTTQEGD